jgi:type III secretion system low calcium response chaperone LcrH/SycD
MADDKKPADEQNADAAIQDMDLDEMQEHIDKGEVVLPSQRVEDIEELYTPEKIDKFIMGDITWAQLQGMTMEEAYGIAEYGYGLYQEGKYHDARTVFEGLVLCNPYDAYFHNMLGAVCQQLDLEEEAHQAYSTAIDLDEENLHALVNRGELQLKNGEFDKALDDLERAIALDPDGNDPAALRARALAMATAKAMEALKDILEKANKK